MVLFIVHLVMVQWFMPEHHTNLAFCRSLLDVQGRIIVKALGVEWEQGLSLGNHVRGLEIPWDLVERESHDRGSYLVALKLAQERRIEAGNVIPS